MSEQDGLLALCGRVAAQRLPRWAELPDLELYMDQVLSLIERYLGSYPGFDGRGLTASMVNNYVKLGVMPPPVRKKYTRVHLAYLIVICVLKASLPIDSIRNIVAASVLPEGESAFYDRFCDRFEATAREAAEAAGAQVKAEEGPPVLSAYCAALRAQAEQALALELYRAAFPEPPKKEPKKDKKERKESV